MIRISTCILFMFLTVFSVKAQVVFDPNYKSVYSYLSRISQRGVIDLNDAVSPISRMYIYEKLSFLKQNNTKLTPLEKKELEYYLLDYTFEKNIHNNDTLRNDFVLLNQKYNDRPRLLGVQSGNFTTNLQPIVGIENNSNSNSESFSNFRAGFWAHGYIGKNFGYSLDYRTNISKGDGFTYFDPYQDEQGTIGNLKKKKSEYVYTDLKASIAYNWKWGQVAIAKENLTMGYGSKIILSGKAPTYPMIRLDVSPLKWLDFHYAHAWLNSEVVDSSRIRYSGYGNRYQINDVPKKMAIHAFNIKPFKGLSILVGESIIYNDEVKLSYLIPINFFRSAALFEGEASESTTTSNSQMFFQVSSRNHIPKTHLYASYFIDEMDIKNIKNRNQSAYNLGFSVTDAGINNLTLSLDYFKALPWSYVHHMNTLSYQHSNYNLGHYLGSNADELTLQAHYRILRGLEFTALHKSARKGELGHYGLQLSSLGTPFLEGDYDKVKQNSVQIRYEYLADLFLTLKYQNQKINNITTNYFKIGLTYGF